MDVLSPLRLSVQVAACATLVTIVVGIPVAYWLARARFRGKELVDSLLTLPMVLPPTVTGYFLLLLIGNNGLLGEAFYSLTGRHLGIVFTWGAAVLASFVVSYPLMLKTTRASMEAVDEELINASYLLGRSKFQTALRVVIPLSGRGILAGATLAFARAMGEFGATMMVAGNWPGKTTTMPIAIYTEAQAGGYRSALWMVLIFVGISLGVMYLSNRLGQKWVKA